MHKEIRKSLERNLPQYVLDVLNEEFERFEECMQRLKQMEEKMEFLVDEMSNKDKMLFHSFQKGGSTLGGPTIGFEYGGKSQPSYDIYSARSPYTGRYTRNDYNFDEPYSPMWPWFDASPWSPDFNNPPKTPSYPKSRRGVPNSEYRGPYGEGGNQSGQGGNQGGQSSPQAPSQAPQP